MSNRAAAPARHALERSFDIRAIVRVKERGERARRDFAHGKAGQCFPRPAQIDAATLHVDLEHRLLECIEQPFQVMVVAASRERFTVGQVELKQPHSGRHVNLQRADVAHKLCRIEPYRAHADSSSRRVLRRRSSQHQEALAILWMHQVGKRHAQYLVICLRPPEQVEPREVDARDSPVCDDGGGTGQSIRELACKFSLRRVGRSLASARWRACTRDTEPTRTRPSRCNRQRQAPRRASRLGATPMMVAIAEGQLSMPSTHKAASSRGSVERFADGVPAVLSHERVAGDRRAGRHAHVGQLARPARRAERHGEQRRCRALTLMLETACLLIVLTALAVVAAQLWIRLVRRADQALALLPADLERISGDEMGRLTQTLGRLSAARTGHAADEAARTARISAELTRRNARGLNCLQQVAALLVEAPPSEFSLVKVLQVLATGIGADSAGLRLSPATRDSLRCPTLLSSHDVPLALTSGDAEIASGTATMHLLESAAGVVCAASACRCVMAATIIAVLAVQAPEVLRVRGDAAAAHADGGHADGAGADRLEPRPGGTSRRAARGACRHRARTARFAGAVAGVPEDPGRAPASHAARSAGARSGGDGNRIAACATASRAPITR